MKRSASRALHVIAKAVPGLRIVRTYKRRWLWTTLFAGVTIFAMLVPQGIANAQLAGVAPVVGLYTAIGALVGYALFGTSQRLMLGPESTTALLVTTAIAPIVGGHPARFALLVTLLALMVGVSVVGTITPGLPKLGLPAVHLIDVWNLLPSSLILTLIVFTLQEILQRAGLTEKIGSSHFFPTVRTGVRAFLEQQEELAGEMS